MAQHDLNIHSERVQVITNDHFPLTALIYTPIHEIQAKVIIACATGVPQLFYRKFATYLAQNGYQVISFDYRGIGLSAPSSLKNFHISYLDWGKYDLKSIIDYISNLHNHQQPIFLIGHSLGGQALGLTDNHSKIKAMLCFGTGAGWSGYMPFKEKFKVKVMWKMVFPPLVAFYGYLPWSKLHMGSDIPKSVYDEWKRWCKHPHYFFTDPQHADLTDQFATVTTTIYAYSALDDDWALPNSRQAFMQHYQNANLNYIDIDPRAYGLKHIGHMGYFRQGAEQLWNEILAKLGQLTQIAD